MSFGPFFQLCGERKLSLSFVLAYMNWKLDACGLRLDVKKSDQYSTSNYMPKLQAETSVVFTLNPLLNEPPKRLGYSYIINSGALDNSVRAVPPKLFSWLPQKVPLIAP